MQLARLKFLDPQHARTIIVKGSEKEILKTYIGKAFNFGTISKKIVKCIGCKIITV
jgi:hypothetical protein